MPDGLPLSDEIVAALEGAHLFELAGSVITRNWDSATRDEAEAKLAELRADPANAALRYVLVVDGEVVA